MATRKTTRRTPAKAPHRNRARGVTRSEPDDGVRGAHGVVACLVPRADGTVRLVLDDARWQRDGAWVPARLYTSREYPARQLRGLKIGAEELEQIGLALVTRLVAADRAAGHGD